MKTNRSGSHRGWSRRHWARAAATSGRSCSAARVVFFITQTELVELVPQSGVADANAEFLQALTHLGQRQVGLLCNPAPEFGAMRLQPRLTIAANLLGPQMPHGAILLPKSRHAFAAHPKAAPHFTCAVTSLLGGDDPPP